MNTFIAAVNREPARTTNGMKALKSSGSACMDWFYKAGALRGQDPLPYFVAAFIEDQDLAVRILQWSRDPRQGAGERETFRSVLKWLGVYHPDIAVRLVHKVPHIGRWDDLFVLDSGPAKTASYSLIQDGLLANNALCAKWMPRKGHVAMQLASFLGLSPKSYRKLLVSLTHVVETQMCAGDWGNINFSHVPSQASRIYRSAFNRHTTKYAAYVENLKNGIGKVNAGAVFPHEVIKNIKYLGRTESAHAVQQWEALPNWIGDNSILPLVDVSGSMESATAGTNTKVTCLDVALGLGLYCSSKNTGAFKDLFLTFSASPEFVRLKGDIHQKMTQMNNSTWGMNTDLVKALQRILDVAVEGRATAADMPKMLLILSDMQFDQCVNHDHTALEYLRELYELSGYEPPKVVFWNIHDHNNVPASYTSDGVALVSGFSPAVLKSILSAEEFTPESVMKNTVCLPIYDW